MTAWLYTEHEQPLRDGPFFVMADARLSPLWEMEGVCLWIEHDSRRGFAYRNLVWNGLMWVSTSKRVVPVEPWRPQALLEAVALPVAV